MKFYLPVPTYSTSPKDVRVRMTEAMIRLSSSLDIVVMLGNATNRGEPAWAPDWFSADLWNHPRRRRHFQLYFSPVSKDWLLEYRLLSPWAALRFESASRVGLFEDIFWPDFTFLQQRLFRGFFSTQPPTVAVEGRVLKARGVLLGRICGTSSTWNENTAPAGRKEAIVETQIAGYSRRYLFEALRYPLTFWHPTSTSPTSSTIDVLARCFGI